MGVIKELNFDNIIDEQDFDLFGSNEEDNTPQEPEEEDKEKQTAEVDPNDLFDGEPESVVPHQLMVKVLLLISTLPLPRLLQRMVSFLTLMKTLLRTLRMLKISEK